MVKKINLEDIYIDKNKRKSFLISIIYFKENENVESKEIKEVEDLFLEKLMKNNIYLKDQISVL